MAVEEIEFRGVQRPQVFFTAGAGGHAKGNRREQGAQAARDFQQVLFGPLFGAARPDAEPGQPVQRVAVEDMPAGAIGGRRQWEVMTEIHRHHAVEQALALEQAEGLRPDVDKVLRPADKAAPRLGVGQEAAGQPELNATAARLLRQLDQAAARMHLNQRPLRRPHFITINHDAVGAGGNQVRKGIDTQAVVAAFEQGIEAARQLAIGALACIVAGQPGMVPAGQCKTR